MSLLLSPHSKAQDFTLCGSLDDANIFCAQLEITKLSYLQPSVLCSMLLKTRQKHSFPVQHNSVVESLILEWGGISAFTELQFLSSLSGIHVNILWDLCID